MLRFSLLLLVFASCTSTIGKEDPNAVDAKAIDYRVPPEPKDGTGTSPACNGVTARGECQQGTAVYCDLDRNRLRNVDCEALGQNCILDVSRGAVCKKVDEDTGGSTGTTSACTDTNVSEAGYCTADGIAVFCDTTGAAPVTRTWNCGDDSMTCGVDDCVEGAFCCGGAEPIACGDVDYRGSCDGSKVQWCHETNGLQTTECSALGQRCEVDACADGAYCCGESSDECTALGFRGECTGSNSLKYCTGGEIEAITCDAGYTCQVDNCENGAGCCEQPAESRCLEIGIAGVCNASGQLEYCFQGEINTETCTGGQTCQIDAPCYSGGASCCDVVDPCTEIGPNGICDGNTLKFCPQVGDVGVTETDCSLTGKSCEVNTCLAGKANCC